MKANWQRVSTTVSVAIDAVEPAEDNEEMKIEILYIDECPNFAEAGDRVREALVRTGNDEADVKLRLLRTSEDAALEPFAGSPTIIFDDEDLFPSGERTTDLACRIYITPAGLAGLPTISQLVKAVEARRR